MLVVGGKNEYNQFSREVNEELKSNKYQTIISKPSLSVIDIMEIKVYSIYSSHSVIITNDNRMLAVGNNTDFRISCSLPKKQILNYQEFKLFDSQGVLYIPISVVCGELYTLYMVINQHERSNLQLVYSYSDIEEKSLLFLKIESNIKPVSLFGGYSNSAAIDSTGSVILIISKYIRKSPHSALPHLALPGEEEAVNVAFCEEKIFILTANWRVFECRFSANDEPTFYDVIELATIKIVNIAGTKDFCFAVSDKGHVYGYGQNKNGALGFGIESQPEVLDFTLIENLQRYHIISASAGVSHSLFITMDGVTLALGSNQYGQMLLKNGATDMESFFPIKSCLLDDANFCIAGDCLSAVFMERCPINQPNTKNHVVIDIKDTKSSVDSDKISEKKQESKCCILI